VRVRYAGNRRTRRLDHALRSAHVRSRHERPGSDLDLLVELEPGARPFAILTIAVALEEALGVKVDVGTLGSLRSELRSEVLAEAIVL
jgi:predicted nucleotidyltransferase